MYGATRARRTVYVLLVVGLVTLGAGLWGLRGTRFFRYVPMLGALAPKATPAPVVTAPVAAPTPGTPTEDEVIALIQGYNQGSILSNQTNDLEYVLPYVCPGGPLYDRLLEEFRRRIAAGEVRSVELTRFWATEPRFSEEEIVVETKETWDETTLNAGTGEVLSSAIGVETYQVYTMRRDSGGVWRIWDLDAQVLESYVP